MRVRCLAILALLVGMLTPVHAQEAVAPAPTPPPTAGPTKAAAQGFCGDVIAAATDLITRYSSDAKLKQVYKSGQYLAYADNDKDPTVMFTLTTDSHPAHPAAVCRRIVKEGDSAIIKMNVVCDGKAEECAKLTNEFNVMTLQMQQEVDNKIKSGVK